MLIHLLKVCTLYNRHISINRVLNLAFDNVEHIFFHHCIIFFFWSLADVTILFLKDISQIPLAFKVIEELFAKVPGLCLNPTNPCTNYDLNKSLI